MSSESSWSFNDDESEANDSPTCKVFKALHHDSFLSFVSLLYKCSMTQKYYYHHTLGVTGKMLQWPCS